MESLRQLYRIGTGPSSSHTMAPRQAALTFLKKHPGAAHYRVTLFGSLAATGRGHLTDKALFDVFQSRESELELVWVPEKQLPLHPNGMRFEAVADNGSISHSWEVYSVGGGALQDSNELVLPPSVYSLTKLSDILDSLNRSGESLWEYVLNCEDADFLDYLDRVWDVMSSAINRGLTQVGILSGGLGLGRKAHTFYRKSNLYGPHMKNTARVWSYALAVSEENASGGMIVTAPTCGDSGVLPAVLRYLNETLECSYEDILRALATAGLIGNLVKKNASISGAEVGCQGEVGTACAMAAAAATQLHGGTNTPMAS